VETAGLVEFATRTYDPTSRVWVQEDSFTGTITRASSLNRYAYVEGSPASHTDVLGAYRAASAMAAQQLSTADYAEFMAQLALIGTRAFYFEKNRAELLEQYGWEADPELDWYYPYDPYAVGQPDWMIDEDDRVYDYPVWYGMSYAEFSDRVDQEAMWRTDRNLRKDRQSFWQRSRDALSGTNSLEEEMAMKTIWEHGADYYGGTDMLCGTAMECFTGSDFDFGLITLGHTIWSGRTYTEIGSNDVLALPYVSETDQVHEYRHVLDVEMYGAAVFYGEYVVGSVINLVAGGDPYRDIEFEKSARRDEEALDDGEYEWPEWLDGS
jgi:RHS repeat-associated protein